VTPILRPYQLEAVDAVRQAFGRGHRRVLFVMATGAGKTVTFSHITENAAAKGNRVLILVHRVELLDQASQSLQAMGVRHGLIAAQRSMNLAPAVQIASVQTIARRLPSLPRDLFQLLIVDEAHHSTAGTWAKVINHFNGARVLGVTATPARADGRGLGEQFDEMVLGPTPAWLTEQGFLAPARVFAPPIGFDAKGLHKRMGDYDMREAEGQLSGRAAMGDAISHYRQHLAGQTAIAFCCSVSHAEAVAALFTAQGIPAASIDGRMEPLQRRQLLGALGSGDVKVLTSCSLIGEGVDVPSVAGCILLRPTQSLALHLQMIGRALRPQPGKTAIVLDHVGNVQRLGHHLDEQEWTLEGAKKRDRAAVLSVKVCPRCFAAVNSRAPECPECGHRFAVERRELQHVDGELVEVRLAERRRNSLPPVGPWKVGDVVKGGWTVTEIYPDGWLTLCEGDGEWRQHESEVTFDHRPDLRRQQGRAQTLDELIAVGHARKMRNPRAWARHVLAARQAKGQFERVTA
jgi:superfamily II DNA or RNA helicase